MSVEATKKRGRPKRAVVEDSSTTSVAEAVTVPKRVRKSAKTNSTETNTGALELPSSSISPKSRTTSAERSAEKNVVDGPASLPKQTAAKKKVANLSSPDALASSLSSAKGRSNVLDQAKAFEKSNPDVEGPVDRPLKASAAAEESGPSETAPAEVGPRSREQGESQLPVRSIDESAAANSALKSALPRESGAGISAERVEGPVSETPIAKVTSTPETGSGPKTTSTPTLPSATPPRALQPPPISSAIMASPSTSPHEPSPAGPQTPTSISSPPSKSKPVQLSSPTNSPSRTSPSLPSNLRPAPIAPIAPPPRRPTQLSYAELKKDPKFRALSRRYTSLIVAIPVAIVTSYVLFDRYRANLSEQPKARERGSSSYGLGSGKDSTSLSNGVV